jgi:hypothetical protein
MTWTELHTFLNEVSLPELAQAQAAVDALIADDLTRGPWMRGSVARDAQAAQAALASLIAGLEGTVGDLAWCGTKTLPTRSRRV